MRGARLLLMLAVLVGLASCAPSKFYRYTGPQVTSIEVFKSSRNLYLMHGNRVLKRFDFEMGFAPYGHKMFEGDGRTPEGRYYVDRRNPNSEYHLSVGISYPNARDRAIAEELGLDPGGDIFFHGTPDLWDGDTDWTVGCIAVSNDAVEDIYSMVGDGTPVNIYPVTVADPSVRR